MDDRHADPGSHLCGAADIARGDDHRFEPHEVVRLAVAQLARNFGLQDVVGSRRAATQMRFDRLLDAVSCRLEELDRLLLDLQNVERSPLLPGQTVSQGYGLRIPPDAPPGSYPLITGLYLSATGAQLNRADGSPDNFLYLTDIVVR